MTANKIFALSVIVVILGIMLSAPIMTNEIPNLRYGTPCKEPSTCDNDNTTCAYAGVTECDVSQDTHYCNGNAGEPEYTTWIQYHQNTYCTEGISPIWGSCTGNVQTLCHELHLCKCMAWTVAIGDLTEFDYSCLKPTTGGTIPSYYSKDHCSSN